MSRSPTLRLSATIAMFAFGLANGFSVSGLHGLDHERQAVAETAAAASHAGHSSVDRSAGEPGPGGDPVPECACVGSCAGVTPPVPPASGEASLPPSKDGARGAVSVETASIGPRSTDYLVPLPNAPPVRD